MQPSPIPETSSLLFPSLRFCIASLPLHNFLRRTVEGPCQSRSVVLPGDGPVFIRPGGADDKVSVCCEFELTRQVFANKQVSRIRSLHVVRHRMRGLVYVIASKRSL